MPVLGCRSFGPLACPFLFLVRPVGVFVVCLVSVVPASRVGCPLFVFWGSMETPPELTPPFSSWVVLIVGRSGGPGCTCCLSASPLRSSSPVKFICPCSFSVTSVPVQRWRSLSVLRIGSQLWEPLPRKENVRCLALLFGQSTLAKQFASSHSACSTPSRTTLKSRWKQM